MSTAEAANLLHVTDRTVRNLIGEAVLPAVRCASGWCIDPHALETLPYTAGRKRQACPVSECCGYAVLPQTWVESVAAEYRAAGYAVDTGTTNGEWWVRVHGIRQADLCAHLNDPVGAPGEQQTRHPNTNRHQRKVKRPLTEHDKCCMEEEARYLRPDENDAELLQA